MAEFYHEALGLPLLSDVKDPSWVDLDVGGARLSLHAIPPRIARTINVTTPPRAREETPFKLVFEVEDVAQTRRQLSQRGATMFEPRPSASGPMGTCEGLDPEGNVFQLVAAGRS